MIKRTRPPQDGIPTILYDGECRLCRAQAETARKLGRNRVAIKPLQNNLVAFPNLELEEAMREMKLIDTDGHIYGGAESIVRLITYGHPLIGKFLKLYYLPGLRWLADQSYAWVAKNRYRLFGRADLCDDGSCAVHFPDRAKVPEPPKTRRSDLQGH